MASSKCKGFLKDEKIDLQREQMSEKQEKLTGLDFTSDECALTTNVIELQTHLYHALEKTCQWLEYDQQREAYVRAILARMLWLEKQLNEANQARLQQHNEDHSDEEEQLSQMQEYDEGLLQEAEDKQEMLTEDMTYLLIAKRLYQKKECEVEELKLQLETETVSRKRAEEHIFCSEYEKQQLREEAKDLQRRLDMEKRMSSYFEHQGRFCQEFFLHHHHADQEKIADLERQRDQEDDNSCEGTPPPSLSSRGSWTSSSHSSLQNESFLECPSCQARCPASLYQKLLSHLDNCIDQRLSTFSHLSLSDGL